MSLFKKQGKRKYIYLVGMSLLLISIFILSGCSSGGSDDPVPETEVIGVDSISDLKGILVELNNGNKDVKSIDFESDIKGDAVIRNWKNNKNLVFNLNNKTLTGNLNIENDQNRKLTITNGKIDGNLIVNAPNLSLINNATVTGSTKIEDVSDQTFENNGKLQSGVIISDTNGGTFHNTVEGTITGEIEIKSVNPDKAMNLKGHISENEVNITGRGAKVKVLSDAKVKEIKIDRAASGVELNLESGSEVDNVEALGDDTVISIKEDATVTNKITIKGDNNTIKTVDGLADGVLEDFAGGTVVETINEISGKVNYNNFDNVKVLLVSNNDLDVIESYDEFYITAETEVDSSGNYSFYDIDGGSYYVIAYRDLNNNGEIDFYTDMVEPDPSEPVGVYKVRDTNEVKITVTGGENKKLEIFTIKDPEPVKPMTNFISGKINNFDGNLSNVKVWLVDSSADIANLEGDDPAVLYSDSIDTGEDYYLFEDVAPGSYYIFAFSDDNKDNIPGLNLFGRDPDDPRDEPLGFYGGFADAVELKNGDTLNNKDITISTNYLAARTSTYNMDTDVETALPDSVVKLYDAADKLLIEADNLFETNRYEEKIAFALLTGLKADSYYLEASHRGYVTTITPLFEVGTGGYNSYSRYYLELFTEEFLKEVFAENSFSSSSPYVLSVIEEYSPINESIIKNLSITLDGPGNNDYQANSSNIGYLSENEAPPLDFNLNSFKYFEKNYDYDGNIDYLTFVAGAKNIVSGRYDAVLVPGDQYRQIFYAKDGKLTFIQSDPSF